MSQPIQTARGPLFPLPVSRAVQADDFVYVSGQVGFDPAAGGIAGVTIEAQTRQCIRNVEEVLQAAGLTLDHVVKVNAHVARAGDFAGFNEVYAALFRPPYPARTTVRSGLGRYLVEMEVVAYARAKRGEN